MITAILIVLLWVAVAVVGIGLWLRSVNRKLKRLTNPAPMHYEIVVRPDSFAPADERDIAQAVATVAKDAPTLRLGRF